ncbi:hypothetical protein C8J57DRAFT_1268933 [Mycena rebaudengoi]|nr:hypothetical protein C8J57DRAFT_1268933 [Mycena rebaudengoi]
MPIFQDSNGFAVKFFIQKNLPEDVQAELCETITSLGGRVESKVPRQGYLLRSVCASAWSSPERPERFFVPYTYVEACKIAGMLLRQIFIEDGAPMSMHIHPSIANVNARNALSQRIMHSGGDPYASAHSARVILADPNTDVFQHLIKVYQGVPDKYVESYLWVKKCVERSAVVYTPLVYKNPGGRRPGEERTQFTDEDEKHLARWIAAKIPYKETGGRTGNRLYQQLCDLSADPDYAWVTRHTWQSWRERYKKHALRLDAQISEIVAEKKPVPGEKGQYGYVRQAEAKPRKSRKKKGKLRELSLVPDEPDLAEEASGGFSGDVTAPELDEMPVTGEVHDLSGLPAYESTPGAGPSTVAPRPAEEEDDESEWAVRVGDAPIPLWGKRKAAEDAEREAEHKRMRTDEPMLLPASQSDVLPQAFDNLHVLDQGIRDIAAEFRFTVEEVQAHYDRCGEMRITRIRFQNMRQILNENFPDDE